MCHMDPSAGSPRLFSHKQIVSLCSCFAKRSFCLMTGSAQVTPTKLDSCRGETKSKFYLLCGKESENTRFGNVFGEKNQ